MIKIKLLYKVLRAKCLRCACEFYASLFLLNMYAAIPRVIYLCVCVCACENLRNGGVIQIQPVGKSSHMETHKPTHTQAQIRKKVYRRGKRASCLYVYVFVYVQHHTDKLEGCACLCACVLVPLRLQHVVSPLDARAEPLAAVARLPSLAHSYPTPRPQAAFDSHHC